MDWHPSQVHACLQPGVCLQVCLLSSVPSGPREPPTHVPERPCPGAENRENGAISQSPDSCFLHSGGGCGLIRQVWEVCSVCCSLASVTPKTLETLDPVAPPLQAGEAETLPRARGLVGGTRGKQVAGARSSQTSASTTRLCSGTLWSLGHLE